MLSKSVRLDIFLKSRDFLADIEMQVRNDSDNPLNLRSRFYQSKIDNWNLDKGYDYKNLLQSYIIFISPFDPFESNLACYTFKNICLEDKTIELNDKTTKIFLYTKGNTQGLDKDIVDFLNYCNTNIPNSDFINTIDLEVNQIKK